MSIEIVQFLLNMCMSLSRCVCVHGCALMCYKVSIFGVVCRLDIARDEAVLQLYPKRIILIRHGEVSV